MCASSFTFRSGKRVSNPRPAAWEAAALPTELLPRIWLLRLISAKACKDTIFFVCLQPQKQSATLAQLVEQRIRNA